MIEVCPVDELAPGEMRLVEWEDLEIGVFNCGGTLYAIEDRCSHDNGPLAEGEFDPEQLHGRMPAARVAVRSEDRQAEDFARVRSGGHVPGDHRRRDDQAGGGVMAVELTENEQLAAINADYEQRYGFHDAENYLYKAPKGLNREIVEKISEFKSEPQWMREFRLKALDHFLARPQPTWGSPLLAEVDYDDIHYFVRASERAERSWDDVPEDVKKTFDRLGHPRGRAQVPVRRGRPVRVRGRLPPGPRGPREAGRDLQGHGLGAARARGPRPRVLRHRDPAQRQQAGRAELGRVVGRLVRLRAPRASTSRCRSRPTSGSTPRTWASSSAR